MANKTPKTRNPDRRGSGKAWSKDHDAAKKIETPVALERHARHARKVATTIRHDPGAPLTMPNISWEWFNKTMIARWPSTRKVRVIDSCIEQTRRWGRRRDTDGVPIVVEQNPEAKKAKV